LPRQDEVSQGQQQDEGQPLANGISRPQESLRGETPCGMHLQSEQQAQEIS
jgi:hypothetical protein